MSDFALWDAPPIVTHVVMNGNKLKMTYLIEGVGERGDPTLVLEVCPGFGHVQRLTWTRSHGLQELAA